MGQRLFVAIDAGSEVASAIGRAITRVRAHAPRAAWTDRTAPHLTLVFLVDVPDDGADSVRNAVPSVTVCRKGWAVVARPTFVSQWAEATSRAW